MQTCDRCGKETYATILSMFNMDTICLDCHTKEQKHPKYADAKRAELDALGQGNFNFSGIGKPADL